MKRRTGFICVAVLGLLGAGPARGLQIGDPAPPISITDWIKGKPIDVLKDGRGKIIVLEFWATWCPPCIQLIPATTQLHQKYKDKGVIVVGLTDMGRGQSLKTVQDFVRRQGKQMDYPVAFDRTQRTTLTYQAFGLPHAVVIGKNGKVVWMGHPGMPEMKQVIDDLVHDRYDAEAAARQAALNQRLQQLTNELYGAMQQGRTEAALSVTERMLDIDPANLDAMQFRVAIFVDELRSVSRLRSWVEEFITARQDNAEALAKTAHLMMAIPDMAQRQPDLAVKAARMALAADQTSFEIPQAAAMVFYEIGDLATAKRYQRVAIERASGPAAEQARAVLKFFETCESLHAPETAQPD
jgi:thiol-disulfide isomerase/thioredoxin